MPWSSELRISLLQNPADNLLAEPIHSGFLVFLIGGLTFLMIYHLFLYFQNRDTTYLLYASYLLFIILSQILHITSGFLSGIVDSLSVFGNFSVICTEVSYILYFFFAYKFLNVKEEFPKQYRYLQYSLLVVIVFSIGQYALLSIGNNTLMDQQLYLGFVIYVLILSVVSYVLFFRSKNVLKYYLIVGSILLLVFSIASVLYFGYLTMKGLSGEPAFSLLYIGLIVENIIFSLGLGKKQKLILDERNSVQQVLIEQMKQNERLEVQFRVKLEEEIEQLKQKLEEDTRERLSVYYEKELAELKLASLRSQMNPHFIFNSLNSIKGFIIDNNQRDALFYLNKFSKLVRKILSASIEKDISLAEEIEIAQLYLQLEGIRFKDEIDFDLQIDKDLALNTIQVPALIFQPFLENAIWHGLSSVEGEKRITMLLQKRDDIMEVVIADNGIGRARAEKMKERKLAKRESYGLKLTEDRLRSFVQSNQGSYSLQIVDLVDQTGQGTGTQIEMRLSIVYKS